MGSSAKRKREKKKDFQKKKLKVGKAKQKPDSFTDTSFKSRAIAITQQSLSETAPDAVQKFKHNLSLAATSCSDRQRREALSFLTQQLSASPSYNPVGTREIVTRLLPLIPNQSNPVRSQLLKLLKALPPRECRNHAEDALRWVRAGMTHLSKDVSNDALSALEWLLQVAPDEAISCPGGWATTLKAFCAILGWSKAGNSGWTMGLKSGIRATDTVARARQLAVLAKFLQVGLQTEVSIPETHGQYWAHLDYLERRRDPFAYLNLYGSRRDEEGEMYQDRAARLGVFNRRFLEIIAAVAEQAKKEGGGLGRSATALDKILSEAKAEAEDATTFDASDLLDLW